jgi:hypothetical protein
LRGRTDRGELAVGVVGFALGLLWLVGVYVAFFPTALTDPIVSLDYLNYDIEVFVDAATRFVDTGAMYAPEQIEAMFTPGQGQYFYYAPPFGLVLTPLAIVDEAAVSGLWYWLKVAAMLAACLLMPVKLPVRALTFAALALSFWAMRDLVLGNVGLFLLLPLIVAWRWMDRPLGSVATAIAIAIRPSLGAILLWQLLRRRWTVAAWTIGSGLVLLVLSLPFVGIDGYLDYLKVLGNLESPGAGSESRDLGATAVALGLDEQWMGIVRFASLLLGAALILLSLRKDRDVGFMITLAASMLLIGQLWEFYLLVLALPLALIADRWRPVVLLVLLLSWLPSAFAPVLLLLTLALLFVLPLQKGLPLRANDV